MKRNLDVRLFLSFPPDHSGTYLERATGTAEADPDKPIVAIANSFTQFVPGHVHLKDLGQLVAREIERAGASGQALDLRPGTVLRTRRGACS